MRNSFIKLKQKIVCLTENKVVETKSGILREFPQSLQACSGMSKKLYWAQAFWQADSRSASQDNSRVLWNPNVYYSVQTRLLLDPILKQINQSHSLTSYFLKIYFNITFLSMHRSPKWFVSAGVSYWSFISVYRSHAC